jgi:GTPase
MDLHARWSHRAPTAAVNDVLERAQSERAPARGGGRVRYATQVASGPPAFVLFGTKAPAAPYRRFLEGRLRRAFDLDGVPIRLTFRSKRSSGGRDGGI